MKRLITKLNRMLTAISLADVGDLDSVRDALLENKLDNNKQKTNNKVQTETAMAEQNLATGPIGAAGRR